MISTVDPPPKIGAPPPTNGIRGAAGASVSGDGCCDNVGARAHALLDQVPPCTRKLFGADQILLLLPLFVLDMIQ
jgi:hypothetical protein